MYSQRRERKKAKGGTYRIFLVVLHEVAMQRAEEDHGHHGRQEHGDQNGVDEREPLHVGLRHGPQNVVPATGPLDPLRLVKLHRVQVRNLQLPVLCLELFSDFVRVNDHWIGTGLVGAAG